MVTASKKPAATACSAATAAAIAPLDTLNTAHNALGTARTAVTTFLDHLEKSRHLEDNLEAEKCSGVSDE